VTDDRGGGGDDRGADVFAHVAPAGFEVVACPGCGGKLSTAVRQGKDWVLHTAVALTIHRCDGCGLHFLNPRPRIDQIGRYYPADYHSYQMRGDDADAGGIKSLALREAFGAPSVRPTGAQRALARAALAVKRAESFGFGVPWHGEGRLLDFGCGGGKFLRRMHALGWDVTGIDFSETSVQAVRDAGLKAIQGTLPHPELHPASFDVITMRHALEHVPDPPAVLRAARDLLATGGRLVIQVPNYDAWDIDYFGDAAVGLDLPRHLIHFTPATLSAMLQREKFRVIDVRAHERSSWIRKAAKNADRGPKRSMARVLRSSVVCRVVARMNEARRRGNEIIAVAEKVEESPGSAALRPGASGSGARGFSLNS
jgi:2-polyprenyl-3-methyl-5-hydroxy-6-metoxy-1,4-benzoquinol methylase